MNYNHFQQTLTQAFAALPNAVGINNHMGSALTQQPLKMRWLMKHLQNKQHFFLDSRTSATTVAEREALRIGIPTLARDVFLDHHRNQKAIQKAFARLITIAQAEGSAIAIGHPYPETIAVLQEQIPRLQALGVRLKPLSHLMAKQPTPSLHGETPLRLHSMRYPFYFARPQ